MTTWGRKIALWSCAVFLYLTATFLEGCGLRALANGHGGPIALNTAGGRTRQRRSASGVQRGESLTIAGLKVSVWRPAGHSAAPLVIFSHGFHGSSTQSTILMQALASHGYLVVAPNHRDSGFGTTRPQVGFGDAHSWSDETYRDRAQDIRLLIAALKADRSWSTSIDWPKVALAGHSLGGYTVLGLGGAWPSWRLPGVKAVLALSPYANPFIDKKTLGNVKVPVMYQSGTRDFGIGPFLKEAAFDPTPSPAYYIEFEQAGHFAWTDLNPKFQDSIAYYCLAFLDKYVKGDRTADPAKKRADVALLRVK